LDTFTALSTRSSSPSSAIITYVKRRNVLAPCITDSLQFASSFIRSCTCRLQQTQVTVCGGKDRTQSAGTAPCNTDSLQVQHRAILTVCRYSTVQYWQSSVRIQFHQVLYLQTARNTGDCLWWEGQDTYPHLATFTDTFPHNTNSSSHCTALNGKHSSMVWGSRGN
jgi:hypothetical protein